MSVRTDVIFNGYSEPSRLDSTSSNGLASLVKIPTNLLSSSRITATGTCTLVRTYGINILFDTLGPWQAQLLEDTLANNYKLHPDNIDYVVCSHSHADHIGNLNLFTNAKLHLVGTCPYREEEYFLDLFEPNGSYSIDISKKNDNNQSTHVDDQTTTEMVEVITYRDFNIEDNPNIRITPTLGHTLECISMIVDNVDQLGKVALVGDLFEKEQDLTDDGIWIAAGSKNIDLQRANRKKILSTVDYIVPGHGPMFKVPSNN